MSKAEEKRYEKLGYGDALQRSHQYPMACQELSFILGKAYTKLPKNLQFIIFQDTLLAFRLLPQMQTSNAISAAHLLLQSAEATLPKQKKKLAVTEFKHAMVAHKRLSKAHPEDKCSVRLPQDVLIHIFSFLNVQSLVSVGPVCRAWNIAAADNHLWESHYRLFFARKHNSSKANFQYNGRITEGKDFELSQSKITSTTADWKEAFKREYIGSASKKLTSKRGYCRKCKAVVWLDSMKCCNRDCTLNEDWQFVPVSSYQIVDHLVNGSSISWEEMLLESSSDSDSESDERLVSRLWADAIRARFNELDRVSLDLCSF